MSSFNLSAICSELCAVVSAKGAFNQSASNGKTQVMSPSLGSDLKI